MPPVSEAQRRAMYAAAEGKSTLGIPQSVGKEFIGKDDATAGHAAGILFVAPDGDVLLLRRSSTEKNFAGHWALPGGKAEDGETPEQAARREVVEETGREMFVERGPLKVLDQRITPTGMAFHTFVQPVVEKFAPTLNDEHTGYAWAPLGQLPQPIHPGVDATLRERLGCAEDMSPEDWATLRENFAKWTVEEEKEAEHGEDENVDPVEPPSVTPPSIEPAAPTGMDSIALDRASVRTYDQDGHLHVEVTPISKANVCPYWGREIPDAEALGLDPNRVYRLLRHPDEIARGAPTFAGKPLLLGHTPVSADDHPTEKVVGTIGDGVRFEAPYLVAPLTVWDGEAIKLIETGEQRELSCGYRYRADMTPGTFDGEPYDGVMRDIVGNHVALVEQGRAGPDVIVGDSAISKGTLTMKLNTRAALLAHGALVTYLAPKLAQDAKIDLTPILSGVTAKTFKAKRPDIVAGLKKATAGKLAADASIDDADKVLAALDENMDPRGEDDDLDEEDEPKAEDEDDDEAKKKAEDEAEEDEPKGKDRRAHDRNLVTQDAMNAAIAAAVRREKENQRAVRQAEEDVRPYIGKIQMGMDSAEDVYLTALKALNVDVTGVHPSAFKAILKAQPVPGSSVVQTPPRIASDAASVESFYALYPEAKSHSVRSI